MGAGIRALCIIGDGSTFCSTGDGTTCFTTDGTSVLTTGAPWCTVGALLETIALKPFTGSAV